MKRRSKSRKADLRKVMSARLPEDYPWKVLEKLSLDLKENLTDEDFSRISLITRNRDFEGYLVLAEEWSLQCIVTTGRPLAATRAQYLLASLIKKFQFPTSKEMRVARATEKFLGAEGNCKLYNNLLYRDLAHPETEYGVDLLHYARQFLVKLLGQELPGNQALLNKARHGPGATIGTSGGQVNAYYKYSQWPYSCTIDAYRYARFAIETDQRWLGALQDSYRQAAGIPQHMPLDSKHFWSSVIYVVDGNRITFVPKDARTERTIAIEPTMNLYLQLGVDGFIRKRLKRFGVDLDDQRKNQRMAREGSVNDGPNGFVTVDLSAASDSIAIKLCESLLPPQWYSYLMDLRSPGGELEGGDRVSYEKISSMGNGYTFALESAIFTAIVYAVLKSGGEHFNRSAFAVYGDDIIVEKRWYFRLVEALRLCGFTINSEKTCVYGPIRESCGADWLNGLPIRPVFLTEVPTDATGLMCDYNRIKRLLSLRWAIDSEESKALDLIRRWVPKQARCLLGPLSDEDFDSYMHTEDAPLGIYKRDMYKYTRLVPLPRTRPGRQFLFRKLMHDLRGAPPRPPKWERQQGLIGKGSRFRVTDRNVMTLGYTSSAVSEWRSTYAELDPS